MPDNEIIAGEMTDELVQPEQKVEVTEEIIPDPEPSPVLWAVSELSVRAVSSVEDLAEGETLVTGERPLGPEQRAESLLQKAQLLALATEKIAPLQDAVDLDEATENEMAALKEWKKYRVLLNRLDVATAPNIVWPEQPTL